ncbi:DUF6783 domain-containing protein [uncultured Robinsoniella sp.]
MPRYAPFIRDKSPTICDAQLPESNFKTRSRIPARIVSQSPVKVYHSHFL